MGGRYIPPVSRFVTRTYAPGERAAPLVRAFVLVEADGEATSTLLPDPGFMVAFRYRGASWLIERGAERRTPDAAVTGLRGTARRMRTAARSGVVVARLRSGAAAQLFDGALDALFGVTVPLAELAPAPEVSRTLARIASARDDAARLAAFEEFLLERRKPRPPDPVVAAALQTIEEAPGEVRVAELARALGLGQDALEKRFRRAVGAPPKRFASILRLRRTAEGYRPGASLGALAVEAGYYDQSHFNRELRAVADAAPGELLGPDPIC